MSIDPFALDLEETLSGLGVNVSALRIPELEPDVEDTTTSSPLLEPTFEDLPPFEEEELPQGVGKTPVPFSEFGTPDFLATTGPFESNLPVVDEATGEADAKIATPDDSNAITPDTEQSQPQPGSTTGPATTTEAARVAADRVRQAKVNKQAEGLQAEANARQLQSDADAATLATGNKRITDVLTEGQKRWEDAGRRAEVALAKYDELAAKARNFKVDPDRFFSKNPTRTTLLGIAAFLKGGTHTAVVTGRNSVIEQVNRYVEQDIAAQENEMRSLQQGAQNARTIYQQLRQQGLDALQATQVQTGIISDQMARELKQNAAKSGGAIAQAKAAQAVGALEANARQAREKFFLQTRKLELSALEEEGRSKRQSQQIAAQKSMQRERLRAQADLQQQRLEAQAIQQQRELAQKQAKAEAEANVTTPKQPIRISGANTVKFTVGGTPASSDKKLTRETINKVQSGTQAIIELREIVDMVEEFGVDKTVETLFTGRVGDEEAEEVIVAAVNDAINKYVRSMSGAQATDAEAVRAMQIIGKTKGILRPGNLKRLQATIKRQERNMGNVMASIGAKEEEIQEYFRALSDPNNFPRAKEIRVPSFAEIGAQAQQEDQEGQVVKDAITTLKERASDNPGQLAEDLLGKGGRKSGAEFKALKKQFEGKTFTIPFGAVSVDEEGNPTRLDVDDIGALFDALDSGVQEGQQTVTGEQLFSLLQDLGVREAAKEWLKQNRPAGLNKFVPAENTKRFEKIFGASPQTVLGEGFIGELGRQNLARQR